MTTEALTWIDPGSTSYAFDGSSYYTALAGRQGFFAPPVSIIEQETPLIPGASIRFVKTSSRPLKVPLLVKCPDESTFATVRRTLRYALNPNRGAGTLQSTAADGSVRQLACYCEAGYEGDETIPARFLGGYIFPLAFRALWPYWQDLSFTSVSKTSFPVTWTITNGGDVDLWPIWTITGPATALTITNNTTGKSLTVSGFSITSTGVIVIDTRSVQQAPLTGKSVTEHAFGPSTSYFQYLSNTSSLFPLAVGGNSITVSITGSGVGTSAQVQYKQNYEGV